MGFLPGPAFRVILEALVDAQLEGRVRDAADASRFVRAHYAPPDGRALAGEEPR
jgi:hypothetical protein